MLQNLSDVMLRLAQQRHLRAIRDGIVATLPLIIVGSFFLIVAFPPLPQDWGITVWAKANAATILLPYRMTFFIMALYSVVGIGYSLAQSYDLDGLTGAITGLTAFLLTIMPKTVAAIAVMETTKDGQAVQTIVKAGTEGAKVLQPALGFVMPMVNLGSAGLFVGMVISMLAVEVYRLTMKSGFKVKMPDGVPPSVSRSFEALTSTAIIIIGVATITYWLKIDLHGIMATLTKPLVNVSDSLISVIIIVLLITLFWSFGIHGVSIVGSLARPVWLIMIDKNTAAVADGLKVPHIAAEPFYQWFIWIGGSGATIGLAILMVALSKSAYLKALGRAAILPSVFNINEPIIFGAPIVLNPRLIPAFIATPIVNAIIAYLATSLGLVNRVTTTPPWTFPGPIGAFLATSDWRGAVLSIVLIIVSILIYLPFFKIYDKQLLDEEHATEAVSA